MLSSHKIKTGNISQGVTQKKRKQKKVDVIAVSVYCQIIKKRDIDHNIMSHVFVA